MTGGLLVAGTSSDAGKSLVVTGLCRWLARQGVSVAPFKAQNMSNNSMVVRDPATGAGAEIGRAQWLQALAARVEPEPAMNPVLLKPGSDRRSHVVLLGRPHGELRAGEYATGRAELAAAAFGALADLRERFDVVVCEGAGSPAEINLRRSDYVNMGLARHARLPVVVVADIDRGGVFAAMAGTLALLSAEDQALVAGWVVNRFRGDPGVLAPGLRQLEELTGRPVAGVLPYLDGVWTDSEDALALSGWPGVADGEDVSGATLGVAVVRFPRISNATDVDALAAEPGVAVTVTADPDVVAAADVVVLPGTRATVDDLAWLRRRGIDRVVAARADAGRPVLGICGGYQVLAGAVEDDVESGAGRVPGLGLLPTTVRFGADKVLARPAGEWRGQRAAGYEIHHGVAALDEADPRARDVEPFLDGFRLGAVWGTTWHGTLEVDGFRRAWLAVAAEQAGVAWRPSAGPGFAAHREAMVETLADAVEDHLDGELLSRLLHDGPPASMPVVSLTRS